MNVEIRDSRFTTIVDENVAVEDLTTLMRVYLAVLEDWFRVDEAC